MAIKRVFICSPFRGSTPEEQDSHVAQARELLRFAVHLGNAPFAPHLLYPGALNDADARERDQGIKAGLNFLSVCQELWWLDGPKGVTTGMRKELELADFLDIVVRKVQREDGTGRFMLVGGLHDISWKVR